LFRESKNAAERRRTITRKRTSEAHPPPSLRGKPATNAILEGPSPDGPQTVGETPPNVTIALGADWLHRNCVNKDMIIERSESAVLQAQELYRKFHARCFWSYRADLEITAAKIT
jgi:hypothetical protein